jgi:hypothetical protein
VIAPVQLGGVLGALVELGLFAWFPARLLAWLDVWLASEPQFLTGSRDDLLLGFGTRHIEAVVLQVNARLVVDSVRTEGEMSCSSGVFEIEPICKVL